MTSDTQTQSDIKIRRAQLVDAEAIASINILSWKNSYRGMIDQGFLDLLSIESRIPGAIKRINRADLDCFVATETKSSRVIGFADFGPCRDKSIDSDAELYAIYIDASYIGEGIGRRLFQAGLEATKKRSYKKMMVSVFTENLAAKSFYEKMGAHLHSVIELELGGKLYPTANYVWDL